MTIARKLSIHGRVQGVFYRASAVDAARPLGLAGWVRNRADGTVEAFVQGYETAVERFVDWARKGPRHARVEWIEESEADVDPELTDFTQRPTA